MSKKPLKLATSIHGMCVGAEDVTILSARLAVLAKSFLKAKRLKVFQLCTTLTFGL